MLLLAIAGPFAGGRKRSSKEAMVVDTDGASWERHSANFSPVFVFSATDPFGVQRISLLRKNTTPPGRTSPASALHWSI